MRYPASEKLEIIRLVEESALPVRRTLEKVGVPRATFYRWYDLYQAGGPEALHLVAGPGECLGRSANSIACFPGNRIAPVIFEEADAEPVGRLRFQQRHAHRHCHWISIIPSGDDTEQQVEVGNRARHRAHQANQ